MKDQFKKITGPVPYKVYQRSSDNTASISILGKLEEGSKKLVSVRLCRKAGESLAGFDWRTIEVSGRSFTGVLHGVPVGGPYTLEIMSGRIDGTLKPRRIPGLLVGDLWLLAGQSNMEGCGTLLNLEPPSHHVNAFYFGDRWGIAKDPLCYFNEALDPVHWSSKDPEERAVTAEQDRLLRNYGAGLGIRFGKDLYKATSIPIGFIVCAHGGTSLAEWSPELKEKGGESLYGSMLRRVQAAGGKVTGCLWYQGESDATEEAVGGYRESTRNFIKNLRSDLNHPNLPFIYVQLSRWHNWMPDAPVTAWNKVQNDQLLLEREIEQAAFAASIDGTLSDPIHLDSVSQRRLGARLAKLARKLVFNHDIEVGPRPGKVSFTDSSFTCIQVDYDCVNGSLVPVRGIRGFTIEKDGCPVPIISCVRGTDGRSVIIRLWEPAPGGANLWYGRGLYPAVNLADKAGFAAPVFGPVKLPHACPHPASSSRSR